MQKRENVSKQTTHVCWDIQLASELIALQDELGQIDEVAELLRQFTLCEATGSALELVV